MLNLGEDILNKKEIRRYLFDDEWWFSVVDIIKVLTASKKPNVYWSSMKSRVLLNDKFQLFTICKRFKLVAEDGKMRETEFINLDGISTIIKYLPFNRNDVQKILNDKLMYIDNKLDEIEF